jgi:hypothetical protein
LSILLLVVAGFSIYSQSRINTLEENISNLQSEIDEKNSEINSQENTISALEGEIDNLQGESEKSSSNSNEGTLTSEENSGSAKPKFMNIRISDSIVEGYEEINSLNEEKEGKLELDIANDGSRGEFRLTLQVQDRNDYILEEYEKVLELDAQEREKFYLNITAPEHSYWLQFNLTSPNNDWSRDRGTVLTTTPSKNFTS